MPWGQTIPATTAVEPVTTAEAKSSSTINPSGADGEGEDQAGAPADSGQVPLTPKEQVVLDIIRDQPVGRGIIGKKIIKAAKERGQTITSEAVLTRHIIPRLKPYGVVNARGGRGYVIRPT
ncbi:MAG TPA: hypothetical protein VFB06_02045 [Streptosporangiaceae bacterium]|nr:hypothetical protein [Streptosporangiaceae bacterium]